MVPGGNTYRTGVVTVAGTAKYSDYDRLHEEDVALVVDVPAWIAS